jgi:hypothetical protein
MVDDPVCLGDKFPDQQEKQGISPFYQFLRPSLAEKSAWLLRLLTRFPVNRNRESDRRIREIKSPIWFPSGISFAKKCGLKSSAWRPTVP